MVIFDVEWFVRALWWLSFVNLRVSEEPSPFAPCMYTVFHTSGTGDNYTVVSGTVAQAQSGEAS